MYLVDINITLSVRFWSCVLAACVNKKFSANNSAKKNLKNQKNFNENMTHKNKTES